MRRICLPFIAAALTTCAGGHGRAARSFDPGWETLAHMQDGLGEDQVRRMLGEPCRVVVRDNEIVWEYVGDASAPGLRIARAIATARANGPSANTLECDREQEWQGAGLGYDQLLTITFQDLRVAGWRYSIARQVR